MTELLEPTISKRKVANHAKPKKKSVHLTSKMCEQANNAESNRKSNSRLAGKASRAATSISSDTPIDSDTASTDSDETPCFVKGYN